MLTRKCQWVFMALLAVCCALPMPSWALGLGEIEVSSALNERFSGTIGLLDAEGFQSSEIIVSMASREDFERVGVERFFYLTNLKFEVQMTGGTPQVNITSSQPISEPYLNFIVEVLWPRGRLLKEFTVLLDPPTFSQAAAPAVQAPSQVPAQVTQAPVTRPQAAPRAGTQVELAPRQSTQPRRPPADGMMTSRDDTLWKIASRTLPSNRVSVNQQMLAIQRKNPQAFINNNINLLKAGYVLDIPTESEALSLTSQEANQTVAAQTEDWRSGRSSQQLASADRATQLIDEGEAPALRSQVDATAPAAEAGTAVEQAQGQVRIVANTGELASGTASGDDPTVNQLIEEKETLARQVDELTYQLDREKDIAANQVTVKDRQLEVKDAEIAALQEQMKEMRAAFEESQNQNQSPQPTQAEATPWWMSPIVLFGVIGVLVLVLVFALIALRRNRGVQAATYLDEQATAADEYVPDTAEDQAYAAADDYLEEAEEVADTVADADAGDSVVEPFIGDVEELGDADDIGDEFDQPADEELVAQDDTAEQPSGDAEQTQTSDVIGEAEIYIAYGRYGQAANLLSGVLNSEPERWDVRLKLLEVYVESHDEESFSTHAQYIVDHCEDEDILLACRELESQLDSSTLDLSNDLETADAEPSAESAGEDDFDLDLDDLESVDTDQLESGEGALTESLDELELDNELDTSADDIAGVEDVQEETAELDGGLDFELEFDAEEESAQESTSAADELGGDLGLDFDPDRDVAEETEDAAPAEAAADDGLEFDLEDLPIEEDSPTEADNVLEFEAPSGADTSAAEVTELVAEDSAEDLAEAPADADDFEFESEGEGDVNATKLDLAEAYVDMGDADGAQDILKEVLDEGTPEQQQKAQEMLDKLAS